MDIGPGDRLLRTFRVNLFHCQPGEVPTWWLGDDAPCRHHLHGNVCMVQCGKD